MSPEATQQPFTKLAADLPDNHKAEYFRNLHEAGISPKDVELAQLLRILQLYKAYYESIPSAVQEAAGKIERLKREIEQLNNDERSRLDASAQLAGQVIQESEKIRKDITQINKHVDEALRQSAESLASRMAEQLSKGIEQKVLMPLQNRLIELSGSNQSFDAAIARNNKAAAALEKSTAEASRFHLRTYVLTACVIVCSLIGISWACLYFWFANRFDQQCADLVKLAEKNSAVLVQLSKSRRTLELFDHPDRPNRKLLIMKDAAGWQSPNKQGVIEFDE